MANTGLDWQCDCGKVQLRIEPAKRRVMTCYCTYCRHFAEERGDAQNLDAGGGVTMVQVSPDKVRFVKGKDLVAGEKYTEKGGYRWYTTCCNSGIAGTAQSGRMPIMMMFAPRLRPSDAIGPPLAVAHEKSATGPVAKATGSKPLVFIGMMAQVMGDRISGRWKTAPFFDASGAPRVAVAHNPWP